MDTLITLIRWSIATYCLYFLLNNYISYFYGISLNDYYQWFMLPSKQAEIEKLPLIFSMILFLLSVVFLNLLLSSIQLKAFGNFETYIYLGNSSLYDAHYIKDGDSKVIVSQTATITYNSSFKNIGLTQNFVSNSSVTDGLGKPQSAISMGNLFASLVITFFFFIPMLGPVHALLSPMLAETYTAKGLNVFKYQWNDSFNALLALKGFSLAKWALSWVAILVLMIYCTFRFPLQQFGKRAMNLPSYIAANQLIEAVPVSIKPIYIERARKPGETQYFKRIETSRRNVTFRFDKDFAQSVYVTAIVDTENNNLIEDKITSHINSHGKMQLKITDDLGIQLVKY
ncbi:hypothetical protein [Psychromonas algicola]|uniref:hypothetical protein n=1 Tax=Psychromonas algicola TaxID=2555642 RepID=UPI00106822D6|nr:hypothetical protein [Psychromonas sp. RZ5]TEW52902.1 hypothetical protein E2R67_00415 [Psychromonas sp. RZ5]